MSSVSRISKKSMLSNVSARAKLEKAQLRLQRLDERKELEKKLEELKIKTEIEEAEIDVRLAADVDKEGSDEGSCRVSLVLPKQSTHERVNKYLEDCSVESYAKLPYPSFLTQSTRPYDDDNGESLKCFPSMNDNKNEQSPRIHERGQQWEGKRYDSRIKDDDIKGPSETEFHVNSKSVPGTFRGQESSRIGV